jgi:peroxiredoxin
MRKRFIRPITSLSITILALAAITAFRGSGGPAVVGTPAPAFTLVDTYGRTYQLSELRGKYVVLEWLNHGCPFIRKHYNSGNMQRLQKEYTTKGVVWLSVISSAPGKEGYTTAEQANALTAEKGGAATAVLFDTDGTVGHAYGARTTPHMFVIDPEGVLIYNGAIDNRRSADVADIEGAQNYVAAALDEAMSGRPVTIATTQPYGCSVKY